VERLAASESLKVQYDAAERLDLEGIVAKRKADPYRPETVWYKIKSRTYTQGEGRWELFQKR
jgi:ATP-dependent DNA ligase